MNSFIFIGGDMRSAYAAQDLGKRYSCLVYGIDSPELPACIKRTYTPELCDNAVLPLPASLDGETVYAPLLCRELEPFGFGILKKCLKKGGTVFTSKVFPKLEEICAGEGYELVTYFDREELAVLNAVPTAEGALEIAIRELPFTVYHSRVLITGFGRVGKVLAKSFSALGARVSVACRKCSDLAWAEIYGCKPVPINAEGELERELSRADVILNTVPAVIFDRRRLMKIRKDTLFIELASVLSVEDKGLAENAGIKLIQAKSLPGKTAPVTAGAIIANTLENILTERSINNGA